MIRVRSRSRATVVHSKTAATLAIWTRFLAVVNRRKSSRTPTIARWSSANFPGALPNSSAPFPSLNSDNDTDAVELVSPRGWPVLPVEIWRRILAFVVRLPGADAVDQDDSLTSNSSPQPSELDVGLYEDRRRLLIVCRTWRPIILEYMAEYLIICCTRQLLKTVETFEQSRVLFNGTYLGEWTRRIDFQINTGRCRKESITSFPMCNVVRLLRCTPNLRVYINSNKRFHIAYETPSPIIRTLISNCGRSLRRIEWNGSGECPSWSNVQNLSRAIPNLRTLRLACLPWFPYFPGGDSAPVRFSSLKTLSLGCTVRVTPREDSESPWEPFLHWLAHSVDHLPELESLEFAVAPSLPFFQVHGHKLRRLRVTSWRIPEHFPNILQQCRNLQTLALAFKQNEVTHLPTGHPSLRRICILPFSENPIAVPSWVFSSAVLNPLDALLVNIERMDLPRLLQVRIHDVGAFKDLIEYSVWLQMWWRRWNIRGVRFEDKAGRAFKLICPEEDRLLDALRG